MTTKCNNPDCQCVDCEYHQLQDKARKDYLVSLLLGCRWDDFTLEELSDICDTAGIGPEVD